MSDRPYVVVSRQEDGPAAVPSRETTCELCAAPCWISEGTGRATVAAAMERGIPMIICMQCCSGLMAQLQDPDVRIMASTEAVEEFRDYVRTQALQVAGAVAECSALAALMRRYE